MLAFLPITEDDHNKMLCAETVQMKRERLCKTACEISESVRRVHEAVMKMEGRLTNLTLTLTLTRTATYPLI